MSQIRREAAEDSGAVFQPDTVLPSQFFAALREKGFVEGEKRLMAAVLADAVDVFMKHAQSSDARARQIFADAEAWLFQEDPGRWFFSFSNICDVLGLNTDYVRRGLTEWREKREPTLRPTDAFQRGPRSSRSGASQRELHKAVG